MRAEHSAPPQASGPRWVASPIKQSQSALDPYVEAVRSHTLVILLVAGAVVAASLVWLAFRAPEYRASAEIFVTPLPTESVAAVGLPLIQDLREPTRTIQTAAELVDSNAAAARTARVLGGGAKIDDIQAVIDVLPKGETNILEVRATAGTPTRAAQLANAYSSASLAVRREAVQRQARAAIPDVRRRLAQLPPQSAGAAELESALNRLQSLASGRDPTLSLAQQATAPSTPLGAPGWLVIALAILAGGVLGVATAVAIDRITPPRVTSEEELVSTYPLPILARLPILPRQRRDALSPEVHPEAREALRTVQVQLDLEGRRNRTVMITSPSPSDGKTTTAVAFAVSLADTGARVILIDTDVRRMPIRAGLETDDVEAEVLTRTRARRTPSTTVEVKPSLRPLLRRVMGHPNLQLLDAMDVGFNSTDVHSRERLTDLVRAAAREADYVILDTPPVGVVSDALTLLDVVDDVLVVARIRSTKRLHVEVARDLLARAGVQPRGYLVIGERTLGAYPYPALR